MEIDPCFTKGFQAGGSKTDGAIPCSASCQYPAKVGIICSEYVGNGAGCEASSKNEFNFVNCKNYNQSSCASHPGCRWRDDCTGPGCGDTCTGPGACAGYPKGDESTPVEATCAGHAAEGCKWQSAASITVAIPNRESPYSQIDYCAQCPEHCRLLKDGEPLTGEFADCGIVDTESHNFVDCTKLKCPDICRVDMKTSSECGQSDPLTLQCEGCPALCRRNTGYGPDDWPSTSPPSKPDNICRIGTDYCSYSDTAYRSGCGAECRLNDSETEVCDACLECPMDCTFYPAIRSDCSEICSDESLAGPVGISPTDYIKKLPGAKGESDVKGVGSLMVPALVLPLFCIVIVIAFIRVLSPILGGDIEIPGLGRII